MLGRIYRGEMYYADLNPVVGSEQYRELLQPYRDCGGNVREDQRKT